MEKMEKMEKIESIKYIEILKSLDFDRIYGFHTSNFENESSSLDPCHCEYHHEKEKEKEKLCEIDNRCISCENDLGVDFYLPCYQHAMCPTCFFQWCYFNQFIEYDFKTKLWTSFLNEKSQFEETKEEKGRNHKVECPMCLFLEQHSEFIEIEEFIYVEWKNKIIWDEALQKNIEEKWLFYWIPKENLRFTLDFWNIGDFIPYRAYHYQLFQENSKELEKNESIQYYWVIQPEMDPDIIEETGSLKKEIIGLKEKKKFYKVDWYYSNDEQNSQPRFIVPYWICQSLGYSHFIYGFPWKQISLCLELKPNGNEYLVWNIDDFEKKIWIEPEYYEIFEDANIVEDEKEMDEKVKHMVHTFFNETDDCYENIEEPQILSDFEIGSLQFSKEEDELQIWNGCLEWEPIQETIIYPNQMVRTSKYHSYAYYNYYMKQYNKKMFILLSPSEKIEINELIVSSSLEIPNIEDL